MFFIKKFTLKVFHLLNLSYTPNKLAFRIIEIGSLERKISGKKYLFNVSKIWTDFASHETYFIRSKIKKEEDEQIVVAKKSTNWPSWPGAINPDITLIVGVFLKNCPPNTSAIMIRFNKTINPTLEYLVGVSKC